MSKLYEVIAVQDRWLKSGNTKYKAEEGYVVHRSFQVAQSETDAIETVTGYYMTPGTKYDHIRAEFVRED